MSKKKKKEPTKMPAKLKKDMIEYMEKHTNMTPITGPATEKFDQGTFGNVISLYPEDGVVFGETLKVLGEADATELHLAVIGYKIKTEEN